MSATTITVSTAAQLSTALKQATGGETVLLNAGSYGSLNLSGITFPSNVTVASANPNAPAVFTGLHLKNVSNLSFDGVTFDYQAAVGAPEWTALFTISGGQNLAIRDSTFDGDVARGLSAAKDGYGTGKGLVVDGVNGFTLESSEMSSYYVGLQVFKSQNVRIAGNDMSGFRSDASDFAQIDGIVIENNYIHDFRTAPGTGDHPDMIQFWTANTTVPSKNIVIRGNHLDIGNGDLTQSVFMGSENGFNYFNVLIEDNAIYNGHINAIRLAGTQGLTIRNNTILHNDGNMPDGADPGVEIPKIGVAAGSSNVTITNNAVAGILGYSGQSGWTVANNAFVQDQNPNAPGYYANEFVMTVTNGLHDYVAIGGGMLSRLFAGAHETLGSGTTFTPSPLPTSPTPPPPPNPTSSDGHTSTASDQGSTPPTNSTSSGDHTSTASDQGSTPATDPTPVAGPPTPEPTPVPVASDPAPTVPVSHSPTPDPKVYDLAVKGAAGTIDRSSIAGMLGSDGFDIQLSVDSAARSHGGDLLRLPGSFDVVVDPNGEAVFRASTTAGDFALRTSNASLKGTGQHDLRISLDNDVLTISVDDHVVGKKSMSGTLLSSGRHDLYIGSPWGQNFGGKLSDVLIQYDDASGQPVTAVGSGSGPIGTVADVSLAPQASDVVMSSAVMYHSLMADPTHDVSQMIVMDQFGFLASLDQPHI